MSKIILLQSQNEGMRKQNEKLQEENFYLKNKLDKIFSIAVEENLTEIKDELRDCYEF